jgi:hypothetical protein
MDRSIPPSTDMKHNETHSISPTTGTLNMNNENGSSGSDDDDISSRSRSPGVTVAMEDTDLQDGGGMWNCCNTGGTSSNDGRRRRRPGGTSFWILSVLTVLIIAAGTLTAVIHLTTTNNNNSTTPKNNNNANGVQQDSTSSSSSSSPPPQSDEYYMKRYQIFQTLARQVSATSTIDTPDTPQYKALNWMVYRDTTIEHDDNDFVAVAAADTVATQRFVQRYTIMVLYFACGGEEWQQSILDTTSSSGSSSNGGGGGSSSASDIQDLGHIDTCDWSRTDPFLACHESTKEIRVLQMDQRRLSGQIPNELRTLTSLEVLDLSFNFLVGTLPSDLFHDMIHLRTYPTHIYIYIYES